MFQLAVSIFMLVTCLSWFLLPESPRYLISQGKVSQVTKVLEKAAKRNGVSLSPEVMAAKKDFEGEAKKEEEELEVYGLTDMFRGSQLKITIAFFITWPVITLLYYGDFPSEKSIKIHHLLLTNSSTKVLHSLRTTSRYRPTSTLGEYLWTSF